jgi:integrase
MPLEKQLRGDFWHIVGTVAGRRIRESTGIRREHSELAEARRIKREHEILTRSIHGEKGLVTFGEAAESYLTSEHRAASTAGHVARLLRHFGPDVRLKDIGQAEVDRAYRAILRPGPKGATKIRCVLTPLRAVMSHAAVRKWCDVPAFEEPSTRDSDTRTTFLLPAQATALVQAATSIEHRALFTFLIGCGTRASEAFDLPWADVDLRGARARVFQKQGTWREVDLPPVVVAALASLPHRDGFVFRPPPRVVGVETIQAPRYTDLNREGGGQVRSAFAGACRRAGLPGRWVETTKKEHRYWQPTVRLHDLRHTWASWHYAMNRDVLRLMVAGGWSNQHMVQRYAHLLPEHYAEECRAWLAGGIVEARRTA